MQPKKTIKINPKNIHFTILCMKKVYIFPTKIAEDICPLPGAGQTRPFPPPLLPPHGEVAKALPVVRLEMK